MILFFESVCVFDLSTVVSFLWHFNLRYFRAAFEPWMEAAGESISVSATVCLQFPKIKTSLKVSEHKCVHKQYSVREYRWVSSNFVCFSSTKQTAAPELAESMKYTYISLYTHTNSDKSSCSCACFKETKIKPDEHKLNKSDGLIQQVICAALSLSRFHFMLWKTKYCYQILSHHTVKCGSPDSGKYLQLSHKSQDSRGRK